jgi:hypothetical protein
MSDSGKPFPLRSSFPLTRECVFSRHETTRSRAIYATVRKSPVGRITHNKLRNLTCVQDHKLEPSSCALPSNRPLVGRYYSSMVHVTIKNCWRLWLLIGRFGHQ